MGQAFGRYEILERIGVGGMAEVYLAKAYGVGGFHKNLVVKKILPHLSHDPRFRSMFVDEAKIAVHLQHQNVVQILDLGRIDDQLFIAMELVEGSDLARTFLVANKKDVALPLSVTLFIVKEALKGLHYAHTKTGPDGKPLGIIHRDVSPANILLSMAGEVKIGDFGIAKAAERSNTTKTGIVKGKLHYMSPEQLRARPLDPRCDVYGMGMVLHTMLSGKHPFEGLPEVDIIDIVRAGTLPAPSSRNEIVPPELDAITMRALALNPEARWGSAQEMGEAIEKYAFDTKTLLDPLELARFMESVWDPETLKAERTQHAASSQASIVKRIEPHELATDVVDPDDSFTVLQTSAQGAVPAAPSDEYSAPVESLADELEGTPAPASFEHDAILDDDDEDENEDETMPPWMRYAGIAAAVVAALSSAFVIFGPGPSGRGAQTPTPTVLQPAAGNGVLDFDVAPWAEVWIDDERAGGTPLTLELTVGTHKLEYETPDGRRHSTDVEIREAQTNRIRIGR